MLPSVWIKDTISTTHLEGVLDSCVLKLTVFSICDLNNKLVNMGHMSVVHNIIHVLQSCFRHDTLYLAIGPYHLANLIPSNPWERKIPHLG